MRFSREKISRCESCPLRDRTRVWGEGPDEGKIFQAFLGEAPGEQEDLKGRPFVGPAGSLLSRGLTEASTERFRTWVFNVISCRPPRNDFSSEEAQEAIACCKNGFEEELSFLEKKHVRVVTPLGNHALSSLGITTPIGKARGSVYEAPGRGFIILPAYHPAFLLRGLQKEIPTWIADLQKAHELSCKVYKKPEENFTLFPTVEDVERFVDEAVSRKALLGVDIETVGLRPDRSKLVVVGLALDGERAITVPILRRGGHRYWSSGDEPLVRGLLQRAFDACPLVFQNALFDVLHLRAHGFQARASQDVLLAHHAVHPELPHNLGYIVSIYGTTPYWKDTLLNREDVILNMDDEELRRYNARDCVVLHQVLEPLQKDLLATKTTKIYEDFSMKLVPVVADMTWEGIPLDRNELLNWKASLTRKEKRLQKKIVETCNLPPGFNLDSDDHLRRLVYGAVPNQFKRAQEALEAYEDKTRKKPLKKNTKKYRDLLQKVSVFNGTRPLWGGKASIKTTSSGKVSVDEQTLISLQLSAVKRSEVIKKYAKRDEEDLEELELIRKTLAFLELFRSYSETSKLLSTYTSFPTWKDGRVHTQFLLHGTKTGRLASRDPNLQNVPAEARKVFKAPKGLVFVEGDFSNLEPRILAYMSGDQESIRVFEEGRNIHDANTVALFPEAKKEDPDWKKKRDIAKKYRLAMNYGGGLYSIYEKCYQVAPELHLSFQAFRDADERYRELHEKETLWLEKTKKEVLTKRELRNAFGRIRIFLGTENEIQREGVNFPIQSTAADIIGKAMIDLHEKLKGFEGAKLLLQVHDSLLVQCKPRDKEKIKDLMKSCMEWKVTINKKLVVFPVEFKTGSNWGEMVAF